MKRSLKHKLELINELGTDYQKCADFLGLVYGQSEECCIRRTQTGESYTYKNTDPNLKLGKNDFLHCDEINIAPSRQEVYIHPDPKSHLLATAIDQKGHTQRIYNPSWTDGRNILKFFHVLYILDDIQKIRVWYDIHIKKGKNLDLAIAMKLLDITGMRIGNTKSVAEYDTYGLTTLHMDFIYISDDKQSVKLEFDAKAGHEVSYTIYDSQIISYIQEKKKSGEIFQADEKDINALLKSIGQDHISAKDIRTLRANATAVEVIRKNEPMTLKSFFDNVTDQTQNTPSVAQEHYIYPGLTQIVKEKRVEDFKKTYLYTKPTKHRSQSEHILHKYLLDELEKFELFLNSSKK